MKIAFFTVLMIITIAAIFGAETSDTAMTNSSEITYNVKFYNTETYTTIDTVLNPGGILGNYGGLTGELKYYLDFRWKSNSLDFQASDIGYLDAVSNATFTNLLTEDYISWHFSSVFLDVGKKKITQSVSFLTSPIDFAINSYNDISKNRSYNLQFSEGKYMANADWFSDFGVIGICYIPEIDFDSNMQTYFSSSQIQQEELRYSINISGVDTALALSYDSNLRAGANFSETLGDNIEIHAEGAYLNYITRFGLTTNMVITGFDPVQMQNIYSPLLTNTQEYVSNIFQIIVGGTYNNEYFSITVEYYYNEGGYDYKDWLNIMNSIKNFRANYDSQPNAPFSVENLGISWMFMTNNSLLDVCQNYLFVRVTNPPDDNPGLSWITLLNLEDLSGMEIFSITYVWGNISLTGQFTFDFGDDYSEFKLLGQAWSLGLELALSI